MIIITEMDLLFISDYAPRGLQGHFIYVFLYFNQNFKYNLAENLYEYSSFWLIVGIIIYLGFGFFFNILANNLTKEEFDKYWHYTYLTEILKNILFALVVLGFFKEKKIKNRISNFTCRSIYFIFLCEHILRLIPF